MDELGTVLMIWAHPDDEAYLAGGLAAVLTDAGQRVVCVTATYGEAGASSVPVTDRDQLAEIRKAELETTLAILGVREHRWLDYPDGACAEVDQDAAAARIAALVDETGPDTVITFGPDGFTGHLDHQAVSRWTDLALSRAGHRPRLLHAVTTEEAVDWDLAAEFGVYDLGKPRVCDEEEVAVLLPIDPAFLDRKVDALLSQESQTRELVQTMGLPRFRAWVGTEAFAVPHHG